MKKLVLFLLLILLPAVALAELPSNDERTMEDFGDFLLPVPPYGIVVHEHEDDYLGGVLYVDMTSQAFMPELTIFHSNANMSAYFKNFRAMDYAKDWCRQIAEDFRDAGMTLTDVKVIYGQRKQGTFTSMMSCRVTGNSLYAEEAHDLYLVQRFYGTHEMGTYFFEIMAESRAQADQIIADLDGIVYK